METNLNGSTVEALSPLNEAPPAEYAKPHLEQPADAALAESQAPAPATPTTKAVGVEDIDSWFAQGDAMREALLARRASLLQQLEQTDERLAQLGVIQQGDALSPLAGISEERFRKLVAEAEQPLTKTKRAPKRAKKAKRAAKASAVGDSAPPTKVLAALTTTPARLDDVAEKLQMERTRVRQALLILHAEGKVKRSGVGGALYSRAK